MPLSIEIACVPIVAVAMCICVPSRLASCEIGSYTKEEEKKNRQKEAEWKNRKLNVINVRTHTAIEIDSHAQNICSSYLWSSLRIRSEASLSAVVSSPFWLSCSRSRLRNLSLVRFCCFFLQLHSADCWASLCSGLCVCASPRAFIIQLYVLPSNSA